MPMEDDDVEMEFVSVMGVLVPMEVTKGVSAEARRFVDGGASSDEEKGGNLGQGISAHYQPQEVETEVKEQENTFTSNVPACGEPSCDKFPLRGNSECTSEATERETLVENEKRHQRIRIKRLNKKLRRKERLKQKKVEKKRSEEAKPTEAKKKKLPKAKAKIEEKQANVTVDQEPAVDKQEPTKSNAAIPNRAETLKKKTIKLKGSRPDDSAVRARTSKKSVARAEKLDSSSTVASAAAVVSPPPSHTSLENSKPADPVEACTDKKKLASGRPVVPSSDAASVAAPPAKMRTAKKKLARGKTPISSSDATNVAAVAAPLAVTKRTTKKSKRVDISARAHSARRNLVSTKPLVSATSATQPSMKHAGHPEDKAKVASKLIQSSETAKTADRISDTWRLESDEETQEGAKGNKSSIHAPAHKTLTGAKKAAGKREGEGVCAYPSCARPATYKCRCAEHNTRPRCSHPNCTKFAHAGGKCIAHGGGPRCAEEGCGRRMRTNGRCYVHGGGVLCSHPKCTTRAKTKGKCIAHGGGTVCSQRGCYKLVTANGKCIAHGGGLNCSHPGCDKRAQLQGRCIEHSQADTTVQDKPAKRFRGATSKATRMKVAAGVKRASERPRRIGAESITTEAAKDNKQPAKRPRRTTTSASPEPQATTMALRSGHRMPRISSERAASQRDLLSAEAALQMALELSKVEY